MAALRHGNGMPLVRIFGPQTIDRRGGTVAFYLLDRSGDTFDVRRLELLAGEQRISLRTGCFCNPGDGEVAHDLRREEMAQCFVGHAPMSYQEFFSLIHEQTGKTPSTMRVSLGIASNFADVYRLLDFINSFRNRCAAEIEDGIPDKRQHTRDTA